MFFNYPLSSHVDNKNDQLKKPTFFSLGFHCCHTEQRVAICCTLPMSIRSCLIWRLSWGSLARGSGGSNSPVKSSQLSRTKRENRTNKFKWQLEEVTKWSNWKAGKGWRQSSPSFLPTAMNRLKPVLRGFGSFSILSYPTRALVLLGNFCSYLR